MRGLWRRTTPDELRHGDAGLGDGARPRQAVGGRRRPTGSGTAPTVRRRPTALPGRLSDGGEDADTIREFDLQTKSFVAGGFVLPRSKQNVDWLDDDTLIVAATGVRAR